MASTTILLRDIGPFTDLLPAAGEEVLDGSNPPDRREGDQRTAACGLAAKACCKAAQASATACLPLSRTAVIPKKP
jgi:hypothetical protein